MAAMGDPEIIFFALKGQQMGEKDNDDNIFYVLSIENVQLMLKIVFKCFKLFQYGCQYARWPPSLIMKYHCAVKW